MWVVSQVSVRQIRSKFSSCKQLASVVRRLSSSILLTLKVSVDNGRSQLLCSHCVRSGAQFISCYCIFQL